MTGMQATSLDKVLFSLGTAAYRVFRLSFEIFLVEHISTNGFNVSVAGSLFLVYSLSHGSVALLHLRFPTFWFGSRIRGICFVVTSVTATAGGFVGIFLVHLGIPFLTFATVAFGFGTGKFRVQEVAVAN